ncbi:MAG TPA: murein biosynthesis integral membrane protein MurJ [Acidimicrobiales bacterium]|nr:murein biosynthesis integral membrane protein MurJ [Acidimicrobiales bacterium]
MAEPRRESTGRATIQMAVGTTLSRVTGLARWVAFAYALGFVRLSDAYNLANTTPNIIYDLVLGGVLSATLIPVFVSRLTAADEKEGWEAVSAVTTLATALLVGLTVAFELAAPAVIHLYMVGNHSASAGAEARTATTLLRLFAPQLGLYGLITLVNALLNTRRHFAAPMFSPVLNNVVAIGVYLAFRHLAHGVTVANAASHPGAIWLLGAGTTAGVLVQLLVELPALWGARVHLRWRWDPGHEAVRAMLRLSGWTFGWVAANQVALWVVLVLANRRTGDVSAYLVAWQFFQLPYGVAAVSIMSAIQPSMAERWTLGDSAGFRQRAVSGLRASSAVMVPSAVGYVLLAKPAVDLFLRHGHLSAAAAHTTAVVLAFLALGLPGYSAFLLLTRAYQAMQDTRSAFYVYLVENGVNVVVAFALYPTMGVRGVALSISVAYTVGAAVALEHLRRRMGGLEGPFLLRHAGRVAAAAAAMGVVVALVGAAIPGDSPILLAGRLVAAVVSGLATYLAVAGAMASRGGPPRPGPPAGGPPLRPGPPTGAPIRVGRGYAGRAAGPDRQGGWR